MNPERPPLESYAYRVVLVAIGAFYGSALYVSGGDPGEWLVVAILLGAAVFSQDFDTAWAWWIQIGLNSVIAAKGLIPLWSAWELPATPSGISMERPLARCWRPS